MERKPVISSNIKSVGYDPDSKTMHVEFTNGGLYEYAGVEPAQHQALISAPSVGKHFGTHVRGQFQHRKIS
jgi:frataxin-like iron-binding protein CyaY